MIDFYLYISDINEIGDLRLSTEGSKKDLTPSTENVLYFDPKTHYTMVEMNNNTWYFVGDIIPPIDYRNNKTGYIKKVAVSFAPEKIRELNGFFYIIKICEKNRSIEIFSSLFSILPLFYSQYENSLAISSNEHYIRKLFNNRFSVNKKYIVEKLLFNYGFLNDTIFEEIRLVPSNNYLQIIQGAYRFKKHTEIQSFFVEKPQKSKNTINYLADLFIENSKKYFPDDHF
jgi:asparagine synthetase B (glutamine-hydrolysing)